MSADPDPNKKDSSKEDNDKEKNERCRDSSTTVSSDDGNNKISNTGNNTYATEDFQPRFSSLSITDQPSHVRLYCEPGSSSSITRYQVPTTAVPSSSSTAASDIFTPSPGTSAFYGRGLGTSAQGSRDDHPGNNFGTSEGNSNQIFEFIVPSGEFGVWPLDFGMMTAEDEDDFYEFVQLQILLDNYLDVTETNDTLAVVDASTTPPFHDDEEDSP